MGDGSILLETASSIGLVYWGRKALDTPTRLPAWDERLKQFWKLGVGTMLLALLLSETYADQLDNLFFVGTLGLGVAVAWQLRRYRPALLLGVALLPGFLARAITWLAELLTSAQWFKQHADGYETVGNLTFLWALLFLFIARSQKKQLTAQEQHRTQAEQAQRLVETRNQTLEREVGQRTAALAHQTDELRTTLQELQDTQSQLIQREKMASLGELTAGIAHEIQNPLNFVNNFADVSAELVAELEEERARPQRDRALEAELLTDLRQNLQRIAQHGGRASGIVRGMLEHSRASTGERAPLDLNALCDEYLRLAYHGLRAKDKSFNATLQTDFVEALPPIEAVAGDLGRVILNLFTNAFYAVQKRQQTGEAGYQPIVRVRTRRVGEAVEIQVGDNGTGIPSEVLDKIFQPFFTTKPAGEGTGLGLSLSYDIVTQGHGGNLTVVSEPGAGTEFTITLPY